MIALGQIGSHGAVVRSLAVMAKDTENVLRTCRPAMMAANVKGQENKLRFARSKIAQVRTTLTSLRAIINKHS